MTVAMLLILMLHVVSSFYVEYAHEQLSPNSIEFGDEEDDKSTLEVVPLSIDTRTVIQKTSDKFLSVALSPGLVREKWKSFDIG